MEFLGAIGAFFSGVASDLYKTMIKDGRWLLVAEGLWTTIYIAVCAVLIGTVIGCLLALCKISKSRVLRGIATTYTTIIRGIPLATQLMIFYFVIFAPLGLDRHLVAILGCGINSGAYVTEIFRAGIQGVDIGQTEAGRSLGLSRTQTMWRIVIPQGSKLLCPPIRVSLSP